MPDKRLKAWIEETHSVKLALAIGAACIVFLLVVIVAVILLIYVSVSL